MWAIVYLKHNADLPEMPDESFKDNSLPWAGQDRQL